MWLDTWFDEADGQGADEQNGQRHEELWYLEEWEHWQGCLKVAVQSGYDYWRLRENKECYDEYQEQHTAHEKEWEFESSKIGKNLEIVT